MSTTIEDILYDQYMEEQYFLGEVEEKIEEIKDGAFRTYYQENSNIFAKLKEFDETHNLLFSNALYGYSLVHSFTFMEILFKDLLIKPFVNIAYFEETITDIIFTGFIKDSNFSKLNKLIRELINEKTGANLEQITRSNVNTSWWNEFQDIKNKRNEVAHNCTLLSAKDAEQAYGVYNFLLKQVFFKLPSFEDCYNTV
jgi:hypothetical protein